MVVGLTLIGFVQAKDTGKGKCTLLLQKRQAAPMGRGQRAKTKARQESRVALLKIRWNCFCDYL